MNIYDFTISPRKGDDIKMDTYKGKVLLIVNTATGCGFTPQYEGLENLYEKYHNQGFEILDFPCDQFGHQAPGTNDEIHEFCTARYKTQFDQLAKTEVIGDKAHPLFKYLQDVTGKKIKWNFSKFLIDREGNLIKFYGSFTKPEKLTEDIEKLL